MVESEISFWYKISSEISYDALILEIDGVERGQWSGVVDWTNETFAVSKGLGASPELKLIASQVQAQERILTASKRSFWLPTFSVEGDVDYTQDPPPVGGLGVRNVIVQDPGYANVLEHTLVVKGDINLEISGTRLSEN